MTVEQQARLVEAVIALMVTLNTCLLAWLHHLQTERWKERNEQHQELVQHIHQCTKEHQNGPTSV